MDAYGCLWHKNNKAQKFLYLECLCVFSVCVRTLHLGSCILKTARTAGLNRWVSSNIIKPEEFVQNV
jgi:hypothetical protein